MKLTTHIKEIITELERQEETLEMKRQELQKWEQELKDREYRINELDPDRDLRDKVNQCLVFSKPDFEPDAVDSNGVSLSYGHPNWQKFRLYVMMQDGFKCTIPGCNTQNEQLHVHHRFYPASGEGYLWDVPPEACYTLCHTHHAEKHNRRQVNFRLANFGEDVG